MDSNKTEQIRDIFKFRWHEAKSILRWNEILTVNNINEGGLNGYSAGNWIRPW